MGGLIELIILGGIVAVVVAVLTKINENRPVAGDPDNVGMLSDLGRRSWSSDSTSNDLTAMSYDGSSDDPSTRDSDGDGIADSMDTSDDSGSWSDDSSSDSSDSSSSDD